MKRVQWVFWILVLLAVNVYLALPDRLPQGVHVIQKASYSINGEPARSVELLNRVHGKDEYGAKDAIYSLTLPESFSRTSQQALYANIIEQMFYVTVDGVRIYSTLDSEQPHAIVGRRPHLIQLPFPLPAATNEVKFHLELKSWEGVALGEIWIGPLTKLGGVYKKRHMIRILSAQLMMVIYLLSALGALAYWYTDRKYPGPIWFSLACFSLAWVTYSGLVVVEPRVGLPLLLHMTIIGVVFAAVALAQFCFEQTGLRTRRQDRALVAMLLLAIVLAFVLYEETVPFRYALVMNFVVVALGIYLLIRLINHWRKNHDLQSQALLVGVSLSLLRGSYTIGASWFFVAAKIETYVVLFAPIPLILTMRWLIMRRYARLNLRTQALNRR
ncbi:MAG: hypothetical protein ACRDAM_22480, partial [Casimicrobium sp.]